MATLSLKISLLDGKVTKTMQFDPLMSTFDACKIIRDKITEANQGEAKDYGIFISSTEDNKIGVWLEPGKNLEFYMLRNGDIVEYKKKMRTLRVRMLDGTLKTMMVDDSQNVANLMVVICTKIGITNYDEYSLVRDDIKEEIENPDKPNYGTLTLKRKQAEKERDVKMDQLRKKLRTDDEVNWIDTSKTLRGQGVDESETVLLRRKYFFSDQNIDSRDPVQLNLLYVQARDAILDGTHPVTLEKACEFAGIQCQIQFGDHKEDKHTTGFLDLREFLPASYMKVKSVEKKVFKAHKNYLGQSELDAKVTYTKTARALSTYGVAFFLVKEKLKGKNKLVPRLLGVTKDSVLRLDERTKEILQTWPLTTVRRWCASPNTFTLDFGDYSDQYYSVQTTEAEQILQLIAGYIDIILKKQKAKDHFGIEGDEGSTMVEDSVSPLKATILQHESSTFGKVNTESLAKPAIMRAGAEAGQKPYAQGHMGGAQFTTISGKVNMGHAAPTVQQQKVSTVMSEPQRALLSTISSGREVIRITEKELVRAQLPELGSDAASIKWKEVTMDTNKQNVSSQIAAMNAATAQVVTLTSGPTDEVDHTAVGAAITTIASNLPEVTKGVSMIAALMEDNDNGDKLLDATRRLCTAFSDLLKAAEPETKEPRQNLLNAASRVGEASTQVLYTIGEESEESREIQDMLLALAKAVANTTAALVLKAKNVAATCKDDQQAQNRVIGAATQCALATSQLVACAKVVAPTLQSPACRDQLSGAARQVALAVRKLVTECESTAPQGPGLADVTGAAADVARALDQLMHHVNTDRRQQARETIHETHVENIMTTTDRLFSSQGDPVEMVKQARLLGQATAQLIQNIKVEAERQPDSETQRRLMAAAKLLADATAKMVEAARQCASSPHDKVKQEALCRAAEELKYVTVDYASSSPDVKKQLFTRLETVAKQAASTGTQFITSVQNAGAHITNRQSQETLVHESRTMAEQIPRLIEGVKGTMNRPDDSNSQLDLINASEAFLQPGAHAAQAARAVLPTIQDQASALQLNNTTQQLATTCSELRSAVSRARASCSGIELDAAAQIIRSLQRELAEVDQAARDCRLRPLPGETAESASRELGSSNREAAYAVSRLVSAAQQGSTEYAGKAARDTAQALRSAAGASRALAATQPNSATMVINSTQEVMSHSLVLVEEVKRCLASHETADHTRLASIAKNVTVALDNSVNSMPSHQDVDQTIESINETLQVLSMGEFPPTNKSYNQLQQELNVAAEGLSSVAGETAQAASSPAQLGNTSKQFGTAFNQLLGVSMEMAGQTTDYEVQNQMVLSMKNVTVVSAKLLTTARYVSNDPTQPNSKNQLSAAARSVTDSINYLVDVCTSAAPGQKECDSAVRNIQSMKQLLQHPSEPVNELGYYQCVDTIIEHSRILGKDGMSGMANHVQKAEHDLLGKSVKSIADSICGLIECTAQSAYLVAVSDPSSVAGRPGLVDQAQFARASQVIQQACNNMVNPTSNEEQVLSAATLIAKHTSALCNACRVASSKTTNPVAKRHFVQSAKDVANSTAHLVKEIKALDSDYSQASRMRCGQATVPLLDAVNSLCQFANSPEFVSVPAKISQQARRAQDPILDSGRKIIQGSCSMIESAKCLAVEPNDTAQWRNLDKHSKTVTESIKSLVNNIRDKAPGQSECLAALDILSSQIRELDQVSLQAVSQNLPAKKGNTLQGYTEQMESSATEMLDKLEQLRASAKFEAENLGHSVNQMVSYIEPLTSASVGVASNMVDTQQQMRVLDQTKTVLEGCTQLVLASKESGGNPGATSIHPDVDEYSQSVRDAAADLLANAESLAAQRGIVSGLLDSISRSVTRITDHRMSLIGSFNEADSFVDYQTRMVGAAKEIARLATEMTAKSGTDVSKLATLAGDLTHRFNQLAQDSVGAAATTTNNDVAQRIRSTVVELGNSVITLVKSGGLCQVSKDSTAQRQVADGSKQVSEKVGSVLSALQAGSKGTQACIDAAATVAAIIGDLDTTILFASAGTLHADDENDAFADHRESILKTAKVLVEDTKTLVGGAASSQEQLASAAQNSVSTIVLLSSVVKQGAMSLGSGNPDSQVMLIHSVRDVAAALRDLIQATKDASGKHIGDPAMARLKDSAKVMVTNVTSLLKTVKAVEDEHTRGTRALESTIEAIAQEINVLLSPGAPKLTATPEELVRCTKAITVATAKAVAAGNSAKQDDVIAAANIGRRAIGDMLAICKGAAFKCAETQELKARTLKAGNDAASSYRELLMAVLKAVQGQTAARQSFPDLGRAVAQAAAEIVAAAEALKGSDWVDPDDPTVIAENELLGAAASIDAAANKLAALRPRKSIKEADETLNFDEMILDAAKSIIAATSALVRAASAAQRELIDQGKVARRPLYSSDDGQWSEGLISAARLAAAAAHSLAESANALVQGLGSEERLVSSAKQVAGSTAQLLVACKVKADPNSESTRRLQAAGNAVIKSTDNLVRAAQRAISHEEERCLVLNRRMVGGIAQEINARSEVLRIERQLDEARGRLTAIRQAKYKLKGGDTSGDETDNEITLHSGGQPLKQDGGYTSDSPTHGGRNSSNFGQNTTSFGQNVTSFGQNTTSFGQNRSSFGANNTSGLTDTSFDSNYAQNNTSFGQNNTGIGQNTTSFGQNNTSFGQNNTSFGQNNSNFGQNTSFTKTSNFSSSTMMDKGLQVKQASPPPPNPPPPMTTNLSTFSRSINTNIANSGQNDDYSKTTSTTIPAQNYEAFTTRYETRSYEVPRPLNIITTPEYYSNKMEEEHKTFTESNTSAFSSYSKDQTPRIMSGLEKPKPAGSPLSPKFNAKFDLKREFESSDLSRNNYSHNVLSSNVQDSRTENTYNSLKKNEYQPMFAPKSPVSPKPFVSDSLPYTVQSPYSTLGSKTYAPRYEVKSPKSPSFNTQPGYSETNQSYSFRSETANKGSNIPVTNELARITSVPSPKHENVQMFGKEVYTYGGPNYSQETMTEVKDIPNGTQKVTTTKIYSSTPMKITSTNTKYESSAPPTRPNFDSLNEFTREFGNNDSNYNTLNSDYGSRATDTMKSFTSQSSANMDEARRAFMRPSDYKQSDFQSSTTVSKSLKTPAELNKELDSMERKLLKQTISSEVIEKKTVMTTSSKSESSSTTTKKFGNF